VKLALAGDTMLGRGVGERLRSVGGDALFAPDLVEIVRSADLVVLNLECCISARGEPTPGAVFHFRAPPWATEVLVQLGVDCVTLANNHALDFGPDALVDTLAHLDAAGIGAVGAGTDVERARAPVVLDSGGFRLGLVALTDHPRAYAARDDRAGVAYADLERGELPEWVSAAIGALDVDATLVMPHWGPNMSPEPVPHVRTAAVRLRDAGTTLVAGHSAHVFHGAAAQVLYDLGDFIDDYRVEPRLRNDLGLLFLVDFGGDRLEAIPLKLDYAYTRLADGDDRAWIRRRFTHACAALGTAVADEGDRLVAAWK
jgi:poly-gamma-glutamate capsule biosynthesis protein CapA/YwtB (metallophosphatase superfamily)